MYSWPDEQGGGGGGMGEVQTGVSEWQPVKVQADADQTHPICTQDYMQTHTHQHVCMHATHIHKLLNED